MAKDSDRFRQQIRELKRENAHLKRVDAERQATLRSLMETVEQFKEQIALLKKALFSPRRERYIPSPDQRLLFQPGSLAEETDAGTTGGETAVEDAPEEPPAPRAKRRKRRKRFVFPECLPVKRIEHPLSDEERECPCGCGQRVVISEEITRQLEYLPPTCFVAEHVRFTYGCQANRDGERIITSEKPASINEKGVLGSTVVAWLAQSKFERHLPLYRLQEELQQASQMWFSRSVLCGSLVRGSERLRPLRDLIRNVSTTLRQLPFEFSVAFARWGASWEVAWGTSPPAPLGFVEV